MRRILLTLLLLLGMSGCRTLPSATTVPASPCLSGTVLFASRTTQATIEEVAVNATVSLINTGTGKTEATTVTDGQGKFRFPSNFSPNRSATYYLEAIKGLDSNRPSASVARVRTLARFSGGWSTITAPNIVISPSTTALALGAGLRSGTDKPVDYAALLGSFDTPSGTYNPVTNLSQSDFATLKWLVEGILVDNRDPVGLVGLELPDEWLRVDPDIVQILGVEPTTGARGTSVVFSGVGFDTTPASNSVTFNGASATVTSAGIKSITVTVPSAATSGQTTVKAGNRLYMGPIFTVPVTITGMTPASGVQGMSAVISGTGFDPVAANNLVLFNGTQATVTSAGFSSVTVTVPFSTTGPVSVSVSGQTGTTASDFTYPTPYTISTMAGADASATDGGPAVNGLLRNPQGVAVDASGNLYIADTINHRVRKVNAVTKVITTVAGCGSAGYSGDDGPATEAKLNNPLGLAVDAGGNLYISDTNNHRVRKVDPSGIITTYAGNGTAGFSGNYGLATDAMINSPYDLVTDAGGNLYIMDTGNHRVRKVDPSGIITTYAGSGNAGFLGDGGGATGAYLYSPRGLAMDATGSLYIADTYNHRIRKVDAVTKVITTVAGNGTLGYGGDTGTATNAQLNYPQGVAVDAAGNLYIADRDNHRVRKVATNGIITTLAGTGTEGYSGDGGQANVAMIDYPFSVAVDAAGSLYLADRDNHRIRKVATNGVITTVAGSGVGDGLLASKATVLNPYDLTRDTAGNFYIADAGNHRIRKIAANGIITTIAGTGVSGNSGDGGPATSAQLANPSGVAVDASGNVYFSDYDYHVVRKVATNGVITTVAGTGTRGYNGDNIDATSAQLNVPRRVAVFGSALYIAESGGHRIRKVVGGTIITVAGTGTAGFSGDNAAATAAKISSPAHVAVDSGGVLYIADAGNQRIRKVALDGIITTVAGTGTAGFSGDGGPATSARFSSPFGLGLDAAGNLFVADYSNQRIRKIGTDGTVYTIAGSGTAGFSGDGGYAALASMNGPEAVVVDGAGALYIPEYANHRIRKCQ